MRLLAYFVRRSGDQNRGLACQGYFGTAKNRHRDEKLSGGGVHRRKLANRCDAVRAGADVNSAPRQSLFQAAWLFNHVEERGIVGEHGEYRSAEVCGCLDRRHRISANVDQRL